MSDNSIVLLNRLGKEMNIEKSERLKSIIFQLVQENEFIIDVLEMLRNKHSIFVEIVFTHTKGSGVSDDNYRIELSIQDIICAFNLSKTLFGHFEKNKSFICDNKYDSTSLISVYILSPEIDCVNKILESENFLVNYGCSLCDTLTIYSITYTLYHEIGHIVHNRFIPESEPLMREKVADAFAFTALKSIKGDFDEKNDERLLGAMLGIGQILMNRSEKDENDDMEHPHSIERLYTLLDIWCVKDDSIYWDCAYKLICSWVEKYKIYNSWEKIESISSKDKFKDAYFHFRKFYKNL